MPTPFKYRPGDRVSQVLKDMRVFGTVRRRMYYVFIESSDKVRPYYQVFWDGDVSVHGFCLSELMLEPALSTEIAIKFRKPYRDVLDWLIFIDSHNQCLRITWYELEQLIESICFNLPERWCDAYGNLVDDPPEAQIPAPLKWPAYERHGNLIAHPKGTQICDPT